MDVNQALSAAGQFGFPIFVAVWYMLKQSKDTQQMAEALSKLTDAINLMMVRKGE